MILYNMSCNDVLRHHEPVDCIFADPPDNLGLVYGSYVDKMKDDAYYDWMEHIIIESLRLCKVFWLSYYWKHDLEIKYRMRHLLKTRYPAHSLKTFIWRYTFGQHTNTDCGSGYRFLVRICRYGHDFDANSIRVESERQRIGDSRACPEGRVPDDFWCFDIPRVTGNSAERRTFHPTQHPEELMTRIYKLSNCESVLDLFAGTGTTFRVCNRLGIVANGCEIDAEYCKHIVKENPQVTLCNTL